ncbi:hypothetical protein SAMN05421805_10122 [Saccharopolyspora antimicrobica]|uniref:Uncharacterized protein n=1 Tax=Saccharopolyspora antimicrobica TaxID=455193 RepID=A0A1I4Q9G2_9PSEU|nr:hypothetical protein [Saccharopolyspora antimicrobica]RKT84832.1 hypothetical protein ATL45_3160 [Saccharopolyspora antimicrobica]SFM36699.1 hypothetical protein SAMN05421805_10122 [Saccharopolyspora antimicrobica]
MGDHNGFQVDLEALGQAAQGVNDAIAALEAELPWPVKKLGNDGHGVAMMTLSDSDAGSVLLASALRKFCGKWNYGVKFLVEEGAAAAAALSDTRSGYEKAEQAALDAFKKILGAAADDPMADLNAAPQKSIEQFAVDLTPEGLPQQAVSQVLGVDTKAGG